MKMTIWRRRLARVLGGLALTIGTTGMAGSWAADPPAAEAPAAVTTVNLATALNNAYERQPALAAARASLAAAETSLRTLQNMPSGASLLIHDLEIRKKQACLGRSAAHGALIQAEAETTYAVTRTYLSVLYARAQLKVTIDVVGNLGFYQKQVSAGVKEGKGNREWTQSTVDKITIYLRLAETKQAEAERGVGRATAALKEAIGLDPCVPLAVADDTLPERIVDVSRNDVLCLALSRRGEMIQASAAAQVVCLEADAQGRHACPGVQRTFAAVADIHANQVPQGTRNGDYRPGAFGIEMPSFLAGSRNDRVHRAQDLADRASAVADKARNLVGLDAEDTFLKWQESMRKLTTTRSAAESGKGLSEDTMKDFRADQKVKIEDILGNEVLSAQARSAHNEALYWLNISLADLERVTAGGFCAGLTQPPPVEKIGPPK